MDRLRMARPARGADGPDHELHRARAGPTDDLVHPVGDQALPVRAPLHDGLDLVQPGVALVAGLEARRREDRTWCGGVGEVDAAVVLDEDQRAVVGLERRRDVEVHGAVGRARPEGRALQDVPVAQVGDERPHLDDARRADVVEQCLRVYGHASPTSPGSPVRRGIPARGRRRPRPRSMMKKAVRGAASRGRTRWRSEVGRSPRPSGRAPRRPAPRVPRRSSRRRCRRR